MKTQAERIAELLSKPGNPWEGITDEMIEAQRQSHIRDARASTATRGTFKK